MNPKTEASSSQSKAKSNKNWKGKNKKWEGKGNFEEKKKVEKSSYVTKCKICDKAHSGECWFKGKVKCHKCSRFGHMQKDCTSNYNQLAHYTEAENEETNMFYVGHDTTVQEEAKVWFVDSGCSNHMTANKSILNNIDTSNLTRVKMGNGQLVDTLGRGTIAVHTKNGKMFIKDVMLVSDLKQNLLSLGQLIEHGYYLYFGDNTCKIYDRRNRKQLLAKIEMRKSRSFPLTIEYATQSALKMEVQEDSKLWHKRLGHLNFQSLKKLQVKEMVHELPSIQENEEICEGCALGKQHRDSFPHGKAWRAKAPLELIHTDVCGPMKTSTQVGNKYFLIFVDDYSRMTWVYFLRQKSEVFSIFKKFQAMVERQSGYLIKVLRSDRGGEYTSTEFDKFCQDIGLERQLTVSYTPQQNGVAERKNRNIVEMAKAMLHDKGMPQYLWGEAVNTAVYLMNRHPTMAVEDKTPFEAWSGRKPSVNHLRVFGQSALLMF